MERDGNNKTSDVGTSDDADSRGAVNALILDYYKKFGRKRDLEQYFSLSTAQSDIKDTSGVFWRKMKSENDSSDSGGRKSDSSHEVCRISIRCAVPEQSSSQEDEPPPKSDSPQTQSPPIIIEEMPANVSRHTDDDSFNYDDNNSHKSLDVLLDLSAHKPHSPTSSITSQRKLEWDSLADVGYANESDRKTSASSLSTLERLALKQQYTNNDTKQDIGPPTAHSTPLDENDNKSKGKKGIGKKTTKIYKKDVDFVEVNVPHTSDTGHAPSINVNLTKHISFNVERDGGVTVDNVKNDISVSPEKVPLDNNPAPSLGSDKQMQTSLTKEKSPSVDEIPKAVNPYNQKIPIMICLNTLRKRLRRKKSKNLRRKLRIKKSTVSNIELPSLEKSGEQVSEAESFEYMPGHMYNQNQNQMKDSGRRPDNSTAGNKSSLESTGPSTTESSKGSKHSLTKDLEKCVDLLKVTLQDPDNDGTTKKRLIKDIVHRLVNAKYRDDDTPTEFLSGISFNSKIIGVPENVTTTSTSDANATENYSNKKPKKSILRNDKFNPNAVASTSQSAPNLYSGRSEKVSTNLMKTMHSTDSEVSSRGKTSSENAFPKTSSEELYLKYLEALRREEAYKRHLKDKELFLKQKLVSSETAFKVPIRTESKISSRLKDLMKDLTRNNYDDGSGDASKLEGGSSNMNFETLNAIRNQRSHSVFTLSSSHSECQKRPNLKKKMQTEREVDEAGPSKHHYCCCPHHYLNSKVAYSDSSVQVNIKSCEDTTNEKPCQTKPKPITVIENRKKAESPRSARVVPDSVTGEIKYVCLCNGRQVSCSDVGDSFMIYKCSKLTNRGVQLEDPSRLYNTGVQCGSVKQKKIDDKIELIQSPCQINTESSSSDNTSKARRHSKSSQTNMVVNMCMGYGRYCNSSSSSDAKNLCGTSTKCIVSVNSPKEYATVHEATRCLQTEISINPQISDPTLSDINIINDCDCAQLISEIRKKIHKSDSAKTFTDVCTNSVSEKLLITSEGSGSAQEVKTFNSIDDKESHLLCTVAGRKYHLPILDTNMTLTLNLEEANRFKDPEYVNQGIGTEKVSNIDEAISVNEECKSTQCTCEYCPNQSNKRVVCVKDASVSIKSCMLAKKNNNFNTFPKKEAVPKEKTPFKRSNTDEGKLSICSCIQTVTVPMRDAQTYNNQPDDSNYALETQVSTAENGCQADPIKENVSTEVSEQSDKATPTSSQHQHENVVVFNIKTDKIDDAIKPDSKNFGNRKDLTFERPVIEMIQDITRRYSKSDLGKVKKKKCVSEIMTVLNYLLETEDSTDPEPKTCCSTTTTTKSSSEKSKTTKMSVGECVSDRFVDKSVQLSCKKACKDNNVGTESSDLPCSSDQPTTSSDSAACRVLNKIKKECEKYHQKVKCKGRKCEVSSSTSVNCEKCKKVHHCACRYHKCKRSKTFEKLQKKCIAYNLIIQTSESMLSEETVCENKSRALKNIIVKVPKRKGKNEVPYKTEFISPPCSPKRSPRGCNKSKSGPIESETSEEYARRVELATVREYLEQNRPDFVQNTEERRHCLKFISAKRTQDQFAPSLKMVVVHKPRCMGNVATSPVYCGGLCYKSCDSVEPCIPYAREPCPPCSPHLDPCNPCTPCKPYDQNLCNTDSDPCNGCLDPCNMCSNLQKQALRGAVSLSNYSTVIKI
ncbi:hypothetical protein B5X24_HaOG201936 [Helicoverpa armigera]|uniref:Uncharacterized protein n=1 Tax=Helicoverpa armigera TaxID=29058 RepID=A0A2W1BZF4_HELAM|nr:hypothetical protein B5X24_HaOG201936 [Helicoverpa armigera]